MKTLQNFLIILGFALIPIGQSQTVLADGARGIKSMVETARNKIADFKETRRLKSEIRTLKKQKKDLREEELRLHKEGLQYEKAADQLRRSGDREKAAEMYQQSESKVKNAKGIYLKHQQIHDKIADNYKKLNMDEKSKHHHEKSYRLRWSDSEELNVRQADKDLERIRNNANTNSKSRVMKKE